MPDLDKALADILAIRSQLASARQFHGYGPAALAATGGLALVTTLAQALLLDDPTGIPSPSSPAGSRPRSSPAGSSASRCMGARGGFTPILPTR